MEHMGIMIGKESWAVLQNEPLYSARFIDREGTDELALVLRVEELDWFAGTNLPLTLVLTTWRSPHGTWVAVVTYQLHPTFGGTKGGIFYLNPRQSADAAILRRLPRQENLAVIFLSEDCREHYTVEIPQSPQELAYWQQQIAELNQALSGTIADGDDDPDFAAALQEFQLSHTL